MRSVWFASGAMCLLLAGLGLGFGLGFGPALAQTSMDDFERGKPLGAFWAAEQLQNGTLEITTDPADGANRVLKAVAGGKRGGKVGKADLIQRFGPIGAGGTIQIAASFLIPSQTPRNSIILFDLECASCGLNTNPGLRVYLRNGQVRIDQSKIGIKDAILARRDHQVPAGQWFRLVWTTRLGVDDTGRTEISLDGTTILQAKGVNMPSKKIARQLLGRDIEEAVDRIQVGLTANSNSAAATLYLDNVTTKISR